MHLRIVWLNKRFPKGAPRENPQTRRRARLKLKWIVQTFSSWSVQLEASSTKPRHVVKTDTMFFPNTDIGVLDSGISWHSTDDDDEESQK